MYAITMTLTIKHLQKSDFGGYKCISKNSIGGIEATIRLYGKLCTLYIIILIFIFISIITRNVKPKQLAKWDFH